MGPNQYGHKWKHANRKDVDRFINDLLYHMTGLSMFTLLEPVANWNKIVVSINCTFQKVCYYIYFDSMGNI